jgi:hypothetical protein
LKEQIFHSLERLITILFYFFRLECGKGEERKMKNFLVAVLFLFCIVSASHATIEFVASGTSAKGVDVTFEAQLTLSGDILTVVLTNNSPVDSLNPDDLLGSFYFDIANTDGIRPVLTDESAVGDIYKGVKNGADTLIEMDADLGAPGVDGGWQAKEMVASSIPFVGFGIGTVGNSALSPNGFSGNLVEGINYAIYTGEITTQSLTNPDALVKDNATFVFSGLTGFSEADISPEFAFGLGTAPDSLITPEPATMVLLGMGSFIVRKRKSHKILLQHS